MKHKAYIIAFVALSSSLFADNNQKFQNEIQRLQEQTQALQQQLNHLEKQTIRKQAAHLNRKKITISSKTKHEKTAKSKNKKAKTSSAVEEKKIVQSTALSIRTLQEKSKPVSFYPKALLADKQLITYIVGTPVISAPYLGAMPAFDGSDYIVNISSINRDVRLMEQRRRIYHSFEEIGFPSPNMPIIALSGKVQPVAYIGSIYSPHPMRDFSLSSSEIDFAPILNNNVEGFIGITYNQLPVAVEGERTRGAVLTLNMGFVNIGNLEKTPFYFTGGQLYAPFGRYSSAMISPTLPLLLARTRTRPFILGYKSQRDSGPYLAVYGFRTETQLGDGAGGVNLGYTIKYKGISGEIGGSFISSIDDSGGMQLTGSPPLTTFAGFGSLLNGSEFVAKVPGADAHLTLSFDRYNVTAEWITATRAFRVHDLSYNGQGALPQAGQLEGGATFITFCRPSSFALSYQWSAQTLALNIPKYRINGVYNISIWKDTLESIEYRHDKDFNIYQYANGAASPAFTNQNTVGSGQSSDAVIIQIGVFF